MTVDDYPWMSARVAEDRANEWCEAESFNDEQEVAIVLAAEVRRMRADLDEARGENRRVLHATTALLTGADPNKVLLALKEWETELPVLREKVARVETLAADWIARGHRSDMVHEDAGELVLEALRGEL